ncbi:MAG: hypothetical protein KA248_07440 [Kiritimatiellae bacterium]|nr:hypothetical protein [Kiritimatiellia bacterium]
MKKMWIWSAVAGLAAVSAILLGCEWSTSTDSFNTSKGAGISINFSGVYYGNLSGGRAVAGTSGSTITRLVVQHAGNAVKVLDNNGSEYSGTIGSPGVIAPPSSSGVYPAGALLAQAQINFSGHDNVAARNVNFAGIIHGVAVDDVQGQTETETTTITQSDVQRDSATSSVSYTENFSWTTNSTTITTDGTNITTKLTIVAYDEFGNEVYRSEQTYTVTPSGSSNLVSQSITDNRSNGRTRSRDQVQDYNQKNETVEYTKYYITEANTQYRMQGTWVEEAGVSSGVDALSAGTAGVITEVTPSGAPGGTEGGGTEGTTDSTATSTSTSL